MIFLKLTEQDVQDKTVLVRADMNIPFEDDNISGDTRIRASLASIKYCLDNGASMIVMAHLDRPTGSEFHPEDDVTLIVVRLGKLLDKDVKVSNDWRGNKPTLGAGDIVMLQSARINKGEKKSDLKLGKAYASLYDVFANDAFDTVHRAQASTETAAQAIPAACAGVLMASELDVLGRALKQPAHPMVTIVAGGRVSTKLTILESLAGKIDQLIVDDGIANVFLLAEGKTIGKSLAKHGLVGESKKIMARMAAKDGSVPLPTDVVVTKAFVTDAEAVVKDIAGVAEDDMILDIGPESATTLAELLKAAGTVVWSGPVGMLGSNQFAGDAKVLVEAITQSDALLAAGGGDALVAITKFDVTGQTGYISTGGGAFLEFLEGKELPVVAVLERRGAQSVLTLMAE